MSDKEQVFDLDEPLTALTEWVDDGRANPKIVERSWGGHVTLDFGGSNLTVSPAEHDMKKTVVDGYNDAIIEMVDDGEEEWNDVLDKYDVEDEDRREQLRVIAYAAVDER